MLRESAAISETDVDMHLVNGDVSESDAVEFGNELMNFATAVATRDESELAETRDAPGCLSAEGRAAQVDRSRRSKGPV